MLPTHIEPKRIPAMPHPFEKVLVTMTLGYSELKLTALLKTPYIPP